MTSENHWFLKAVSFASTYFSFLHPKIDHQHRTHPFFTNEYMRSLRFSGLPVTKNQILTLSYTVALLSFLLLIGFDLFIIFLYYSASVQLDLLTIVILLLLPILLPLVLMNIIAGYPKVYLQYKKIHSLGDIPEILSYMVMYIKMVPNLENSVKFAATESQSALAEDLQKMLWDMEIRIYHGIHDGLTYFADQWGQWSEHFKRALHLIRSSIDETDESQRMITLNKALDVGLEGTRDVMHDYAQRLHQPTLVIYSIGIMIPLAVIAMLPTAGLIGLQITIIQVFIFYDLILPLILFFYIRKILLLRPATFTPPSIPDNHPTLRFINKKKQAAIAIIIGLLVSSPGFISLLHPSFFSTVVQADSIISSILHFFQRLVPLSILIIWGFSISVSYYLYTVYHPVKKIRDVIKKMENEFSDSLYIMGKRISEDRSPEESFNYTALMMKGSSISEIYSHTAYNLSALRTTVYQALFNREFGSLNHIYSDRIHSILRLFVKGIKKSQRSASISIIKLADHLKDLQLVEKKIKESLSQLTSTLQATATLFAPMIAGVTLSITKLISTIIETMVSTIDTSSLYTQTTIVTGIAHAFSLENINPSYFVLVIGIYVVELVFLLIRFTNGIDKGDDTAEFYESLAKALPVSILVLTLSLCISQLFLSTITVNL